MNRALLLLLIGCGRLGFEPSDAVEDATPPRFAPIAIEPTPFSTQSPSYVDVPGGALTVPASPGQTWVLWVSARLQSSSFAEIAVEARYLVDGVERGMGGTQNNALDRPGPWQHFYVFTGTAAPTEILFQLRDTTVNTATIDQLRVVAMPVPASADPLYASADPIQLISIPAFTPLSPVAALTLTPVSAGDYIVFLLANATEAPGAVDIQTQWRDPGGFNPWHRDLLMPRQPWQSSLLIRRTPLGPGPVTLILDAATRGQAQLQNIRALALRTTGLASFDVAESLTDVATTLATLTPVATLSPNATTASHASYLALANLRLEANCSNTVPAERGVHVTYDGITDSATHVTENCAYETTYGSVRLLPQRPSMFAAAINTGNGQLIKNEEASLVLIGLD